jgi:hypothetical protein
VRYGTSLNTETAGVIREFSDTQPAVDKGDPDALRIWGEVHRRRELGHKRSGTELASTMTAMMQEDVIKDIPDVLESTESNKALKPAYSDVQVRVKRVGAYLGAILTLIIFKLFNIN